MRERLTPLERTVCWVAVAVWVVAQLAAGVLIGVWPPFGLGVVAGMIAGACGGVGWLSLIRDRELTDA